MKTKEELNALKNEVESLNRKLAELSEDEMNEVAGGGLDEWVDRHWKKNKGLRKKYKAVDSYIIRHYSVNRVRMPIDGIGVYFSNRDAQYLK